MSYKELKLQGCFGWMEFEHLACSILDFISKGKYINDYVGGGAESCSYKRVIGKECQFTIKEIGCDATLFAMFAASGWVNNTWFPKGAFMLSEAFWKRLEEEGIDVIFNKGYSVSYKSENNSLVENPAEESKV